MEKQKLLIAAYNINGLQNKLLFPTFFEYLKIFDIFFLIETHITQNKTKQAEKYFPGFTIYWDYAERDSNYGRAKGGIMLAVNSKVHEKGLKYEFVSGGSIKILKILMQNVMFNIIPVYIRGADWDSEFRRLKSFVADNEINNPVFIGDMNVRIGENQQDITAINRSNFISGLIRRKSRDKEVNSKGRKLLEFCDDYNLILLNGQTLGDEEGEFTYISNLGQSVNDICAVSANLLWYVNKFSIEEKIWSDHLPIVLEMGFNTEAMSTKKLALLPKLKWKDSQKQQYQRSLNTNLQANSENVPNITELTKIIERSAPSSVSTRAFLQKNKWYNERCHWARKKAFDLLNNFRKSQLHSDKSKYLKAQAKYKEVCQICKTNYNNDLLFKINTINNGKEWWSLVKEIRGEDLRIGANISANIFKDYFISLLNPAQTCSEILYAPFLTQDQFLDADITVEEIKKVLRAVKPNKAPGEDRISYEFFINGTEELFITLASLYNKMFSEAKVEEFLEKTIIFPIYKKGPVNEVNNYRGISFMNSSAKIFMGVLNDRLQAWVEAKEIIVEYQAGFRRRYSTADNIYNLSAIVNIKLAERRKVYAFFVDFKAAFDTVPRKSLLYKLHTIGLSYKFIKMISEIYKNTKAAVWTGEELSEYFDTKSGVKQGCLLSPLLFSLYVNDLHDVIEGGINIDGHNIRVLLYADDIVLLAEEPEVMSSMIEKLDSYCQLWNMHINLSKSKMMVFRNGGRLGRHENWKFRGYDIEIVPEYNYLGVILTPRMTFTRHIQKRNNEAKCAINMTWQNFLSSKNVTLKSKWKLFLAVCRSIQAYASQIWGYTYFDQVDMLQRHFLKKIMNLPDSTPNYALEIEFGIKNGHLYTLEMHLNYVTKTLFKYGTNRLPHVLSKIILSRNIFWAKGLKDLADSLSIVTHNPDAREHEWIEYNEILLKHVEATYANERFRKALESQSRIYRFLDHTRGKLYVKDAYTQNEITWIFKARSDLIVLNGNSFDRSRGETCTLCNLQDKETLQHFLGKCPILRAYRVCFFNKPLLADNEVINILDGRQETDWKNLARFLISALNYRKLILSEFA